MDTRGIKNFLHHAAEKQKKMVIFFSSCIFFSVGLIYIGFKPGALAAYQTFCASIVALAIGFFTAHAAQKRSEIKFQAAANTGIEMRSGDTDDKPPSQ
jgi:hypothetical protein